MSSAAGISISPRSTRFTAQGGLASVSPLLDKDLMLHDGGAKSSRMEKMSGISGEVFRRGGVDPRKDLLVVISASGKTPRLSKCFARPKPPE